MKKIALLFDRTYVDAHHCFREMAIQLADLGFGVDLYSLHNAFNFQPFFENSNIQVLNFPTSKFQRLEYWSRILYSKDRRYSAIVATPIKGSYLAYRTASIQKIPFYYLADELIEHLLGNQPLSQLKSLEQKNYISNKWAAASIALGEDRYATQKKLNRIDYPHEHFIIPNAPSGISVRLKSNYFRDIFNIEDRKPIILFVGTLNWNLAKKIYEETKSYGERPYHVVFHARTIGLMGKDDHPFIKISAIPIPANLMNYAVSSADIGLALYDRKSEHEYRNGLTGGKIGTYLKNELPLIAGSADNLKVFEENGTGVYWDGEIPFDEIANRSIHVMADCRKNIPAYFDKNLRYELFFEKFKDHLLKSIK